MPFVNLYQEKGHLYERVGGWQGSYQLKNLAVYGKLVDHSLFEMFRVLLLSVFQMI